MALKGQLLIINHTSDIAIDFEEEAQKFGWDFTTICWNRAKDFGGPVDAVLLLGLSPHHETGFELIRLMKKQWPKVKRYVVTQHARKEVLDQCLAHGASRVFGSEGISDVIAAIEKPPDP